MPNFSGLWTERQQMQAAGASTWPAVPGAPTIGTATATSGTTASVAFTAPSYTGYPAGITSYTATSSPGGLTGTGASSPITVSGLTTGTAYTFTVTATNATGTGQASAASNSVTPPFTYIEDVFSTYLFNGTYPSNTIVNNGIDLATFGGLNWTKGRNSVYTSQLFDSARGPLNVLQTATTAAQSYSATYGQQFSSNGFTWLQGGGWDSSVNFVSWAFRKQPKFFDVVTFTANGSNPQTISHSLGSTPGCIIVKSTDNVSSWLVYHRGLSDPNNQLLNLNGTGAIETNSGYWGSGPTSTTFQMNTSGISGWNFVAYIFAHDAGGFGLTGTDNVISCGSFTNDGSGNASVTLGYEPQWLLYKPSSVGSTGWTIVDNMRGWNTSSSDEYLQANSSAAAGTADVGSPNATGFTIANGTPSATNIYIAIRRGPMKVPTSGTTVFQTGQNLSSIGSQVNGTVGPIDMTMQTQIPTPLSGYHFTTFDRLRGQSYIATAYTNGQAGGQVYFDTNVGVRNGPWFTSGGIWYNFARAPNFFDEVCYTGTGTTIARTHNLGVAPELMIVKCTSNTGYWITYAASLGNTTYLSLSQTNAASPDGGYFWNSTSPTSTQFTAAAPDLSYSGYTYVAYLFATCPGVSKVGSYTGTGTLTTINCGFTGGARWLMIKRTDSTSNWYVWDTVSGMVAGTDPSLSLNTPTAQANANSVYTIATGFQLLASPSADVNTNGGSYIYLAIA